MLKINTISYYLVIIKMNIWCVLKNKINRKKNISHNKENKEYNVIRNIVEY